MIDSILMWTGLGAAFLAVVVAIISILIGIYAD
jgi:hypothetical protein